MAVAILDSGPLVAAANDDDRNRDRSLAILRRTDLEFILPALVVAEVAYILATRIGPRAEARFLRGIEDFLIEAPTPADLLRMADLVEQYADFPLGATDASVVALAERLDTDIVVTLDRRHFGAVRPRHCAAFRLLPE